MSAAATSSGTTSHQGRKARATIPGRRRKKPVRLAPLTAGQTEIEIGTKSVPAPYQPGSYETVAYNRRADILEEERSNKRISVSQYETGRIVQAIFERASGAKLGSGGWSQGGSRDQTIAHELAIIYAIEDAETVKRYVDRVERAIGAVGARMLRQILCERMSLRQYAEHRGKSGERGLAQVAAHFRLLLEGLDEAWAARGATIFEDDKKGEAHPRVLAERARPSQVETDERGVVVPPGKGYRWGLRATPRK